MTRRNQNAVPLTPRPAWKHTGTMRFLGHERHGVWITPSGSGCSWAGSTQLTAWRADPLQHEFGLRIFLRDENSGASWWMGRSPEPGTSEFHDTRWQPGRFEIHQHQDGVEAVLELWVPPDTPGELRRLTLRNRSERPRRIEITSFCEIVLQEAAAYEAHPAFSKLFLQTEFVAAANAVLARRRARDPRDRFPHLVHAIRAEGPIQFETDRARFIGRGRSLAEPAALASSAPLSGNQGNVLDPIASLRASVSLAPGEQQSVSFLLGSGADQMECLELCDLMQQPEAMDASQARALAQARAQAHCLGGGPEEADWAQGIAASALLGIGALDARGGPWPPPLARDGVAGVDPGRATIVLHVDAGATAAKRLLDAKSYWEQLALPIDVVVVSDQAPPRAGGRGSRPSTLWLSPDELSATQRAWLDATAALVLPTRPGDSSPPALVESSPPQRRSHGGDGVTTRSVSAANAAPSAGAPLLFFNGIGGFSEDGREYILRLHAREGRIQNPPPRPWINVIANERFGCLFSETGAGSSWSGNSREHRLTPWRNDSVLDPHAEAIYLRDQDSAAVWSPLPGPTPADAEYEMAHGFGYSRCRVSAHGLEQETTVFVAAREPIRFVQLKLRETSGRARRLAVYSYAQIVLGSTPEQCRRFVHSQVDPASGALLATNPLARDHAGAIAFGAALAPNGPACVSATGDRHEFLGPHGGVGWPAAVAQGNSLESRVGTRLDPCFAHRVELELGAEETAVVCFLLGEGENESAVEELLERFSTPLAVDHVMDEARAFWREGFARTQIRTPDRALDIMVNGWLPYQTLACRIWGRTALYQSGGAFGFRDQLQDASSLLMLWPERFRRQIVLHAEHQFVEGDVLHWWHPPASRGLRTRFADDLLWLPLLTSKYVHSTGDESVLDESAGFVTARTLKRGEDEVFLSPEAAAERASVYEHCCRAVDRSMQIGTGTHGLPLFGCGDWNDGMNRVGREGKGESVWMAFFLVLTLDDFIPLCELRGDDERVARYRRYRAQLATAVDEQAWDGAWYRRGYYDDGAPLGSRENDECRIDALAQAWSVLSGAAPADRARQAMDEVEQRLISEPEGLIRLLDPPFENTTHDPGYIKGYVAGVRENGGQYTHAALWVVKALAALGRRDRVAALLRMLNPIEHARDEAGVARYQLEPYVVAADVYGVAPHVGRGGWSWYTGSSGWMYRVATESLLGIAIEEGTHLSLAPCIPDEWSGFEFQHRLPDSTCYEIAVENPRRCAASIVALTHDGEAVPHEHNAARIRLRKDGGVHRVHLTLGASTEEAV